MTSKLKKRLRWFAMVAFSAIAVVVAIWLLIARLLFGVQVVHTTDVAIVGSKMRMSLRGANGVEGYFVHAMRTSVCWVRLEIPQEAFDNFVQSNHFELSPPNEPERVRRAYGSPGIEGHQPPDSEDWVADDFVPESEYKRTWSSVVFGKRKSRPGVVTMYGEGCPKENDR
jgi:hypothetical protein